MVSAARRYRKSSAPSSVAGHDAGSIDAESEELALTTAPIISSSAAALYSVAFALEPATATQSSRIAVTPVDDQRFMPREGLLKDTDPGSWQGEEDESREWRAVCASSLPLASS